MLFDCEILAINELECVINRLSLKENALDTWTWESSSDGYFKMKKAYHLLSCLLCTSRLNVDVQTTFNRLQSGYVMETFMGSLANKIQHVQEKYFGS